MHPPKMIIALLFVLLFVAACSPESIEPSAESLNPETTQLGDFSTDTPLEEPVTQLPSPIGEIRTESRIPTVTQHPEQSGQVDDSQPNEPVETRSASTRLYRVAFVEQKDVLNVREGPGVEHDVRGELAPGATGLKKIDGALSSSGGMWFRIKDGETDGWVNSRYLVEMVDPATFCDSPEAEALLEELLLAMSSSDGERLSDLVAESRGIGLRRHWWNPEVYFQHDEVSGIFTEETPRFWGAADGSGEPIEGPFSTVMGPLIAGNLLKSTESGCNEIIHGRTAGLVILPDSYEGINYFSLFRAPGPDEFELDWGTWVVGIEGWEGEYYLSFMVHYEWEI